MDDSSNICESLGSLRAGEVCVDSSVDPEMDGFWSTHQDAKGIHKLLERKDLKVII